MLLDYFNRNEFKIGGELPLLLKLRIKQLFAKKPPPRNKVLVVDTCIIGDFLATLPALRAFIKSIGKEVDLVVSPPVRSIAESIRGVNTVYTASSIYGRSNELRDGSAVLPNVYDHVLVLRISPGSYEMIRRLDYSSITTYEIPLIRYFVHLVWNILVRREVRQWREINFEMARVESAGNVLDFNDIIVTTEREFGQARAMPEMQGAGKRVIIHTGSGWKVKLWSDEKWVETIRKINTLGDFDFIFVGGGEQEARSFDYIRSRLDVPVHSLINKIDLKTLLVVMRLSDYFIGVDSGPRNMAHLADLRSISLLGPAPKNFMPVNAADVVIDKFLCRCKSLFYFHKVSAIQKISADEVLDAFCRLQALSLSRG